MKKDTKTRSQHRIKIIEGQINALAKQIDEEAYCMDVLTQSLAIQRSLASLSKLVLEHHISTHIQQMLASNDETKREQAVKELTQLYELNNIRGK
jgi:DNA-binding FrmR family transcriptional regulator